MKYQCDSFPKVGSQLKPELVLLSQMPYGYKYALSAYVYQKLNMVIISIYLLTL